jgi:glyceraldehyde-3-phosphate dehydrogenase (NAD(P))
MSNILIVGTGTIGEPLIGLLAKFKRKINIDNVYFHKRSPLLDEVAKVNSLIKKGAKLVVDKDKLKAFKELGHKPVCVHEEALKLADVIVDCTPAGNSAKEHYYLPLLNKDKKRFFIAQGSEKGFGAPYAYGINDKILTEDTNFIQVVSCNTHNIASILHTIDPNLDSIEYGDFVCIRRANDISQDGSFVASPQVGKHDSTTFGTHHAQDAYDLFRTINKILNIYSSAIKTNTQYMHIIRFDVMVRGNFSKETLVNKFSENKFIATTHKTLANKVFSFGRDHGHYGRIYNQTVISLPSLAVTQRSGKTKISGFCFTPQDGNSLLSSIAASLYGVHGADYIKYMKEFDKFLFDSI